jgi:Mor family transcriptional regulator
MDEEKNNEAIQLYVTLFEKASGRKLYLVYCDLETDPEIVEQKVKEFNREQLKDLHDKYYTAWVRDRTAKATSFYVIMKMLDRKTSDLES